MVDVDVPFSGHMAPRRDIFGGSYLFATDEYFGYVRICAVGDLSNGAVPLGTEGLSANVAHVLPLAYSISIS